MLVPHIYRYRKSINSLNDQPGFSLVEVLVAILLISLFIVVGLQTFVSAIAIKLRAQQITAATNWIQEDLETVKQQAINTTSIRYAASTLAADASSTATTITVDSVSDYRVGDALLIGTDSVDNIIANISGNILTLENALGSDQSQLANVIARCRSDSLTGGFAAYLNANLSPVISETENSGTPNIGTQNLLGKTYTLTRTTSIRNVMPYAVSEINYRVTSSTGEEVANVSTEVVPNAFFQCP